MYTILVVTFPQTATDTLDRSDEGFTSIDHEEAEDAIDRNTS